MPFDWSKVGTGCHVLWLYNYPKGGLMPPDESKLKDKSFLEVTDVGVARMHASDGGLGIANSIFYYHWGMVGVFTIFFTSIFFATTPIDKGDALCPDGTFPWLTFAHKLVIMFNMWEALGLGVIHGPLHGKFAPPFQDWWYRMTPGTMKYNGPFLKWFGIHLSQKRNYIDVVVEGFLTYIFAIRALLQPEVTPSIMLPVMLCSLYEFIFDFGQHMHNYGTQNLHIFICCCFPVQQGQLAGMQLLLNFLYCNSGFCKLGPTFQYFFTNNLITAKFMINVPWADWIRRTLIKDHIKEDYTLKPAAWWLATVAACIEMMVPLLTWFNSWPPVLLSIFTFICMHIFIISTLIIDVFVWNFCDAAWYVILYGLLGPGVDWESYQNMHPILFFWMLFHVAYVIWGHLIPDHVPYVVAHRHAAGNWSQGVLVIKKSAVTKLGKLKAHAGLPKQGEGWIGEWWAFHLFWAYAWNWNLPTKMLHALVVEAMSSGNAPVGPFNSSGDYILIHSVLFFDALIAHLRFDGLSNLDLICELGRVCDFDEGECILCWVGAFPSFVLGGKKPTASWKMVDSISGVFVEGTMTADDLCDPAYKKPSDLFKTKLPGIVAEKKKTK